MKNSRSKRTVLFLDACHTGITVEDNMRSCIFGISDEIDEQFCACFASCRAEERSYSSTRLSHGIWTHHLLEVLSGGVTRILSDGVLTAAALQKYLADEVPRTIRSEFTRPLSQTPRFFGSFERMGAIADLSEVLAKREVARSAKALHLSRISFVATSEVKITALRGFDRKKGHFVPKWANASGDAFVGRLVKEELQEHMQEKFDRVRKVMRTKIKDIDMSVHPGAATLRTPDFEYNITVQQDHESPEIAVWRYELVNVNDGAVLESAQFNTVFDDIFDTVEMTYSGTGPDLRDLAGNLEEAGYEVDCPVDFSSCSITLDDSDATIEFTDGALRFVFATRLAPRELAAGFRGAYTALAKSKSINALLAPA